MDPEQLKRDRRRFHAHTATFLLGLGGWLFLAAFERLFVAAAVPWLLVGFSALVVTSGVLAILVKRTFMSGPLEVEGSGPYAELGDALTTPGLHTLNLTPGYARATAPYAVLGVGLVMLALSGYWAFAGLS
jgi:hypothetical protein